MPLDHKNKNGEFFSNFEFFWNKNKEEWVILFGLTTYELNLWNGPVDASYTDCERVGIVTVGREIEILFTRRSLNRETVSFLDGFVQNKKDPADIFSHPRLVGPLAEFESAMKEKTKIEKEIGSPISWSTPGSQYTWTEYTAPDVVEKLKAHLLLTDKYKDKKEKYREYSKLAEKAENEIKKVFAELTQ